MRALFYHPPQLSPPGITFPVGNDLPSFSFLSFTVGTATLTIIMWTSMFSPETLGSPHSFSTPGHCRESRSESQTRARLLPKKVRHSGEVGEPLWVGSLFLILQPFVVRWSMGLDVSEVLIFQGGKKTNKQVFSVTFPGS